MIFNLGERKVVTQGSFFVAPSASLVGSITLADQVSIWFNVAIRADNDTVMVGAGSNIQDGSVLHVDPGFPITIGERVTVGHKVMLHGCTIGDESLIGMNAVVLNGAKIGKHCLIGANALLTEGMEVPDGSLVLGSPGKVVKPVGEKGLALLKMAADHYIEKIDVYNSSLEQVAP